MTRFTTLVLVLMGASMWCNAQQSTVSGTLDGTVTDSTHVALPNASVIALNSETGDSRAAVTAANGNFRIAGLPVATYEVRVNAAGFAEYTHTDIVLAMSQTVRLAVVLVPAQVQSKITVTAAPSPLDIAQTSETSIIDHERIEELPVRTRNALDFALFAPGVSPASTPSGTRLRAKRHRKRLDRS